MFLTNDLIAIMVIGSVLIVAFIILLLISDKKYHEMVEGLDSKEFPLSDLYTYGLLMTKILHINFSSKKYIDRKRQCELWYGKQYAFYYVQIIAAMKITLATLIILLGFILFGIGNDMVFLLVAVLMAFAAFYYYGDIVQARLQKRSDELLKEFPQVVSQLALLTNAGLIMREAWQQTADCGDGEIYRLMKQALVDMENGSSEIEAYSQFGVNCMIPEIKKFTSTLLQNLTKGNSEFTEMLKQQSAEIWMLKQNRARQLGEKAAGKLLIPISIMFVGILIMIIVPIFAGL